MFLRGQSVFHGIGVFYIQIPQCTSRSEIDEIVRAINKIHDNEGIPYDEIAVIMFQGRNRIPIPGWLDETYMLEEPLSNRLRSEDIPFCILYSSDESWQDHFGETGGVRLIKFQSSLGLDFRAAIICGLPPLGQYDNVKDPDWPTIKLDDNEYANAIAATQNCIQNLYVACTRAKELLYIIAPEDSEKSVFLKMLKESL